MASLEYYAANPLNRLSYLRTSPAFLSSALSSPKSRFLLFDSLSPLATKPSSSSDGKVKLHYLTWEDVKAFVGDAEKVFRGVDGKDEGALGQVSAFYDKDGGEAKAGQDLKELSQEEKTQHFITQPSLIFLGVDERSAPTSSQSLPLSKPDEKSTLSSHSPYGVPYFAIDVTNLPKLKEKALGAGEREDGLEFIDMRAGMQAIPGEEAALGGEGRALIDWNKRNTYCPGCARPLRSVWAGWKRTCVPGEGPDKGAPCVSKKGVHNFNYPRTDPVIIAAILSPDHNEILLGRQKSWPPKFYSCLAGFIEPGESLEEAVRREIWEEAGVEVGEVYYHSSQPWPYPSSLMFGCIGIAKPNQTIRTDLDNELESARFFTRQEVLSVIDSDQPTQLNREELAKMDAQEEQSAEEKAKKSEVLFRVPPRTAIANSLITAFARGTYRVGADTPGKL